MWNVECQMSDVRRLTLDVGRPKSDVGRRMWDVDVGSQMSKVRS